jgi:hypothetical protein
VLLLVALGLLIWISVSLVLAPIVGLALRRCEVVEQWNSVEVLRSKAQHPANQAA